MASKSPYHPGFEHISCNFFEGLLKKRVNVCRDKNQQNKTALLVREVFPNSLDTAQLYSTHLTTAPVLVACRRTDLWKHRSSFKILISTVIRWWFKTRWVRETEEVYLLARETVRSLRWLDEYFVTTISMKKLRWRSRGEVEKSQRREEAAIKTVRASKQVAFHSCIESGSGLLTLSYPITNMHNWVYSKK